MKVRTTTHVEVESIRLDSDYQRTLSQAAVNQIVKSYDERRFDDLVVSNRGSQGLFLVDGQHRLAAAREMGMKAVPCRVVICESKAQEAELFTLLQRDRRSLSAWDLFRADLVAGQVEALTIHREVMRAGFQLRPIGGPNVIVAVAALRRVYRMDGVELLQDVLSLIGTTWVGDEHALKGQVLEGIGVFLKSFTIEPAWDPARLKSVLAIHPAAEVISRAKEISLRGYAGAVTPTTVALSMRNLYNVRLDPKNQLGRQRSSAGRRRQPGRSGATAPSVERMAADPS